MYKNFNEYNKLVLADDRIHKLSFVNQHKNYYVYRITNITNNKHYYGSRSCICSPVNDLGKKYFSSSTDKDFIYTQKHTPYIFKYKILKNFINPGDCIIFEAFLHQYFQVSQNTNFYNKSNQTPFGFSITGNIQIGKKISKSLNTIQSSGLTIAQESGKKTSKSLNTIQSSGLTIAQESGKKISKSLNTIQSSGLTIAQESALKRLKTVSKVGYNGTSIISISGKKTKNTLLKLQENGLSGYQNNGKKISKTLNTIQENGLSISQRLGLEQIGKNNPNFGGYYITPLGKYESAKAASMCGLSWQGINKICKNSNKKITNMSYVKCEYLRQLDKDDIIGKTWKEIGFDFINIINQN